MPDKDYLALIKGLRESTKSIPPEEAMEEVRRSMNKGTAKTTPRFVNTKGEYEELPPVSEPPSWRPMPFFYGGPELQSTFRKILEVAPEVQGRVKSIGYKPTEGLLELMRDSDLPVPPNDWRHINILGATEPNRQDVYIHPLYSMEGSEIQRYRTMLHELSHVMGHDEPGAKRNEILSERYMPEDNKVLVDLWNDQLTKMDKYAKP